MVREFQEKKKESIHKFDYLAVFLHGNLNFEGTEYIVMQPNKT